MRTFGEYKNITDLLVSNFGGNRLVNDLAADDFAQLRTTMTRKWGPVRLAVTITRVKSVFKYGTDNGIIDKAIRYGSEFRPPSRSVLRKHRAASGAKMFTGEEVRKLIDAAGPVMRAMILLGVNCGLGNTDFATLMYHHINLATGWLDFPRPKTGIGRRCPLWPETMAALQVALEKRRKPHGHEDCGVVFLTRFGRARGGDGRTDAINLEFKKLLAKLGMKRPQQGFYTLRHVHRTIADGAKDLVASDIIMGHADPTMAARYREHVDDSRLRAVVDHVQAWLWPTGSNT